MKKATKKAVAKKPLKKKVSKVETLIEAPVVSKIEAPIVSKLTEQEMKDKQVVQCDKFIEKYQKLADEETRPLSKSAHLSCVEHWKMIKSKIK